MEKLRMTSPDLTARNIEKIAELFPNVVTEALDENGEPKAAIDFDLLRQELSDHVVEGPAERYQLNWPGKRQAAFAANAPIAKTLRPVREESVNFDETKNLFIEGDNLEVLKLLQESYLGKIKLIYIDPPYNTGNDFVYEDDYSETVEEYLQRSGQVNEEGGKLVANTESNGRFHSDWLSMMYPRLKLARNLLTPDGSIFISIDENEVSNTRKICDEIFGPTNFLFQITVINNPKGRSHDKYIATCHEYILGYSRNALEKNSLNIARTEEEISKDFGLSDNKGPYREIELRNTHREYGKHNRPNLYYPIYFDPSSNSVHLDKISNTIQIYPVWEDGTVGCWTWGKEKFCSNIDLISVKRIKGTWKVYRKDYAYRSDNRKSSKKLKSVWSSTDFTTEKGQASFNELFESNTKIFQAPKSIKLLKQILQMATDGEDIVLDFFAGSGSIGHATFEQNREDGLNRSFILVQLDEQTDPNSEAAKNGYKLISEISRERLRRAGNAIHHNSTKILDTGFRSLKLDSSNRQPVTKAAEHISQLELNRLESNIIEDRSSEDLIFELMLEWGLNLSLPIKLEKVGNQDVHIIDDGALAACLDKDVTPDVIAFIAELKPERAVFREDGFPSDDARINVEQVFKQVERESGVAIDVKVI